MNRILLAVLCVAVLGGSLSCAGKPSWAGKEDAALAGNSLEWKCLWVWGMPRKTADNAAEEARVSRELGFNAIVIDSSEAYTKLLLPQARARGLEVYALLSPYGEWGFMKGLGVEPPKDCLQEYSPDEVKRLQQPANPDLLYLPGPSLCIDRPEVRKWASEAALALMARGVDGIALDWVGYLNFSACHCAYSNSEREKFAAAHPELSRQAAETQFSLDRMKAYYIDVRSAVKSLYPNAKLMCHLYPQFHPGEPAVELHGNQLPVEHPAQTVSWYFKPHWPIETVASRCRIVKSTQRETYPYVTATAFVGLDTDPKAAKSPQRLRQELQTIKSAGLKGICIAGSAGFLKEAELAKVLSEELDGKATAREPVSSRKPASTEARVGMNR